MVGLAIKEVALLQPPPHRSAVDLSPVENNYWCDLHIVIKFIKLDNGKIAFIGRYNNNEKL